MGRIGRQRPRMIAAQAEGCAPIVRAFEQRAAASEKWEGAATVAAGLRVPKALGDFLFSPTSTPATARPWPRATGR